MGFLDKLLGKFKSETKVSEKPTKEMKLDEALDLFLKRANIAKQSVLSDISDKEDSLEEDTKKLMMAFRQLKNKKIEEEKAKGSERAKDMYAKRALEILGSGFESVEDLEKKLREIGHLSPREAKHLKFFFRDEMNNIARITSQMQDNIDDIKTLQSESILKTERDVVSLKQSIEDMREGLKKDKESLEDINNKLGEVKKERKEISEKLDEIDLEGKTEVKDKITELKSKKDSVNQEIDSSLGSVVRILKKYRYTTGKSDELISDYSKNPHEAFLKDENLKIKQFLTEACDLAEEGDIDVEDKKLSRCRDILKNLDDLKKKNKKIKDIDSKIDDLNKELNEKWSKLEQRKHDFENELEVLEKEMEHLEEKKSKLLVEMDRKKKKMPRLKKELAEKISSVLDVKVRIV